jgi:hypothetical protein
MIGGSLLSQDGAEGGDEQLDLAALEAEFARTMSGATMVGQFTLDGDPGGAPHAESYKLGMVEKLEDGDRWRFESEIAYGDKKYTLPIVVRVKWAGDTPVITLTDMPIPMMGTFTARVVVYRDRYAGIWMGEDHGGQMFGRLVPGDEAGDEPNDEPESGDEED